MAIYHRGATRLFDDNPTGANWESWPDGVAADWQVALFEGASPFTQDQNDAVVSDVEADANLAEITAVDNYARVNLATRVVTNATDQSQFDADPTVFSTLGGTTDSNTLRIALILQNTGGADASRAAVCAVPLLASGDPVSTNGGDITLQWAAGGVFAMDATP